MEIPTSNGKMDFGAVQSPFSQSEYPCDTFDFFSHSENAFHVGGLQSSDGILDETDSCGTRQKRRCRMHLNNRKNSDDSSHWSHPNRDVVGETSVPSDLLDQSLSCRSTSTLSSAVSSGTSHVTNNSENNNCCGVLEICHESCSSEGFCPSVVENGEIIDILDDAEQELQSTGSTVDRPITNEESDEPQIIGRSSWSVIDVDALPLQEVSQSVIYVGETCSTSRDQANSFTNMYEADTREDNRARRRLYTRNSSDSRTSISNDASMNSHGSFIDGIYDAVYELFFVLNSQGNQHSSPTSGATWPNSEPHRVRIASVQIDNVQHSSRSVYDVSTKGLSKKEIDSFPVSTWDQKMNSYCEVEVPISEEGNSEEKKSVQPTKKRICYRPTHTSKKSGHPVPSFTQKSSSKTIKGPQENGAINSSHESMPSFPLSGSNDVGTQPVVLDCGSPRKDGFHSTLPPSRTRIMKRNASSERLPPNDISINIFTCSICLDDYKFGDKVRSLTCSHRYHQKCIDSWLRVSSRCPICRFNLKETKPVEAIRSSRTRSRLQSGFNFSSEPVHRSTVGTTQGTQVRHTSVLSSYHSSRNENGLDTSMRISATVPFCSRHVLTTPSPDPPDIIERFERAGRPRNTPDIAINNARRRRPRMVE